MRAALERMGITISDAPDDTLIVRGGRARLHAPDGPLFVGNSGTTVRFLAAVGRARRRRGNARRRRRDGEAADPRAGRGAPVTGRRRHVPDRLPASDDPRRPAPRRPGADARRSIEPVLLGAVDGRGIRRVRPRGRDRGHAGEPSLRGHHAADDCRLRRRRRRDAVRLPRPRRPAAPRPRATRSSRMRRRPAIRSRSPPRSAAWSRCQGSAATRSRATTASPVSWNRRVLRVTRGDDLDARSSESGRSPASTWTCTTSRTR